MVKGVGMSRDLQWVLTRNWSSSLIKVRGIDRHFSRSRFNPKGLYVPRFEGQYQQKALTVEPNSSGKGVTLQYKKRRHQQKPGQSVAKIVLNKDARRTLNNIKKFCNKNLYRTDLKNVCLRRASAILRSQKPKPTKKSRRAAPPKKTET
ncbi:60S ribosomal protein L28-like [Oppia nitens]|uniref:60S ribosomal protein L28-like n=1 Tax=Oppia nitens TaxID=1686743 RepID=UPI0023D9D83C|nr:60S ribosomal protein L28-like [Oppia nitens]